MSFAPVGAEHAVDHIIDGDRAQQPSGVVTDRNGKKVVACEFDSDPVIA